MPSVSPRLPLVPLWAALAAVVGFAPQPALANHGSVDERCREVDLQTENTRESLCRLVQKAGERGTAECRRRFEPGEGAGDETCARVPIGARVTRQAVAEYRRSWTHRALGLQYALARDVPLVDAPWVGTHNSFNSTSEEPTLSNSDSNQQLSLTDQLDIDVRSLELDVHWSPSRQAGGEDAAVVCHAQDQAGTHPGCSSERLLPEVLAELRDWLVGHPDEVLLLYLENHLEGQAGEPQAAAAIESVLGSRLYKPPVDAAAAGCVPLPSATLTRADVLAAGKQVVLVSKCGATPAWHAVSYEWDSVHDESRPPLEPVKGTCGGFGFSSDAYRTKLVRVFEDSTWVTATGSAPRDVHPGAPGPVPRRDPGLTPATTAAMVACGVDLFGFDQLLPDDGRLAALVWSWDEGEPSRGACAALGADGHWSSRSCAGRLPAACRRGDGDWHVTERPVPFSAAAVTCRRDGAAFAVPRTGAENASLTRAAARRNAGEVWLGQHRVGRGEWEPLDRR